MKCKANSLKSLHVWFVCGGWFTHLFADREVAELLYVINWIFPILILHFAFEVVNCLPLAGGKAKVKLGTGTSCQNSKKQGHGLIFFALHINCCLRKASLKVWVNKMPSPRLSRRWRTTQTVSFPFFSDVSFAKICFILFKANKIPWWNHSFSESES